MSLTAQTVQITNSLPSMHQQPVRANKRLGQHFLKHPSLARKIVAGLGLEEGDTVVEIGCGTGALTANLVGQGCRYIGVEVDDRLCSQLRRRFSAPGIEFLNRDILTLDLGEIRKRHAGNGFRVVGNLPYAISSPILQHLARHAAVMDLAVVMLQAEVADRLAARAGGRDYGVLSLIVQYHFRAEPLFIVPPQAFKPKPKVDSKVVRLVPRPHRALRPAEESLFFGFIKQAFSQRRKTLRNCLGDVQPEARARLSRTLRELGYPSTVRAEKISLTHFLQLFGALRGASRPCDLQ